MRFVLVVLVLAGCSVEHSGLGPAFDGGPDFDGGEGFDGGPVFDGGPAFDSGPAFDGGPGFDGGPAFDGGPSIDAGFDGGPIVDGGPSDAGCGVAPSCDGNTLVRCGERIDCDLLCASAPDGVGCYDLVPSNLGRPLAEGPAAGPSTFGRRNWNTNECDAIEGFWFVGAQPGAREICVLSYGELSITDSIRVTGDRPLVIVVAGTFELTGELLLDASGPEAGPGGGNGGEGAAPAAGPNPGQPGVAVFTAAGLLRTDGGGGGGGAFANGGQGGSAGGSSGSPVSGSAAAGGAWPAGYLLQPLRGGSGGGVGGIGESRGFGGGGGGALQISARRGIILDGPINISGGGGRGGLDGTGGDDNIGAGGGGGSGGSLLLETGGELSLRGGAEILRAGGGGGGGAACSGRGDAEDGFEQESGGVAGGNRGRTCSDDRSFGAAGGAGGVDGAGEAGNDIAQTGGNGGGGGGGAGLVVVRASSSPGIGREADPVLVRVE